MSEHKSIAILQSNYVPWKGYFDIIASVDEFLIFDEVQYTRRDWRNRNKIVLDGRLHWLTIPVQSKGHFAATVDAVEVADPTWATAHWATIRQAYRHAAHFKTFSPMLEDVYARAGELRALTAINELFLRALLETLRLTTKILRTNEIPQSASSPTERLVEICQARAAKEYVSGPAARNYIDTSRFAAAGVDLRYANYSDYPVYDQTMTPFEHGVSILDLLMHCGLGAREHLKSLRDRNAFLDPSR